MFDERVVPYPLVKSVIYGYLHSSQERNNVITYIFQFALSNFNYNFIRNGLGRIIISITIF